jgi:hypothetical protein
MTLILALTLLLWILPAPASATHCAPADTACWEREARQADQRVIDRANAATARDADREFERAVHACKRQSGADAYLPQPGRVQIFGTPQQRYDFGKCMNAAGHPVTAK